MSQLTNIPEICEELFNKVYDDTFKEIRKYVAVKCADIAYVTDIVQEIYLEFYRVLLNKGVNYVENNKGLLYKIANRKIYRYYSLKERLKNMFPLHNKNEENEGIDEEYAEDAFQCSVESSVVTKVEADRIWGYILKYPVETRKILYLFFYENMTHKEIANALNCSESNVKNKIYRTLRDIREKEVAIDD